MSIDLKKHIRQIPDFPKPGINFFDISTLIAHPEAWRTAVEQLAATLKPWKPDLIAGIDARGFIVASPVAVHMGAGMLMVRKKGKLPGQVSRAAYGLEYGTDEVEIQHDAIQPGQRVAILDDLLATGGTIAAAAKLIQQHDGIVAGAACLIELSFLKGRTKLDMPFETLVSYDSE